MNTTTNSNTSTSKPTAATLRQLQAVREQIHNAQQHATQAAQALADGPPALTLDVGLDADLLAAFNGGARQELILLVQIVRLLRQSPQATPTVETNPVETNPVETNPVETNVTETSPGVSP